MNHQAQISVLPNELAEQREAFYEELHGNGMEALWRVLATAAQHEPRVQSRPFIWR